MSVILKFIVNLLYIISYFYSISKTICIKLLYKLSNNLYFFLFSMNSFIIFSSFHNCKKNKQVRYSNLCL